MHIYFQMVYIGKLFTNNKSVNSSIFIVSDLEVNVYVQLLLMQPCCCALPVLSLSEGKIVKGS
jgi:hypothetical protein